jgi:hypothetical protein
MLRTATGSSCRSGIAAVGQTLCQTAYALNLISPFAKSTVPGAHISTAFSQGYSANVLKEKEPCRQHSSAAYRLIDGRTPKLAWNQSAE